MDDADIKFGNREALVGYVETDSGGIVIADGVWGDEFPTVSQDRVHLNLNLEKGRIPVFGFSKGGKRYLLLSLDDTEAIPAIEGIVDVTDLPKEEKGNADADRRDHREAE